MTKLPIPFVPAEALSGSLGTDERMIQIISGHFDDRGFLASLGLMGADEQAIFSFGPFGRRLKETGLHRSTGVWHG